MPRAVERSTRSATPAHASSASVIETTHRAVPCSAGRARSSSSERPRSRRPGQSVMPRRPGGSASRQSTREARLPRGVAPMRRAGGQEAAKAVCANDLDKVALEALRDQDGCAHGLSFSRSRFEAAQDCLAAARPLQLVLARWQTRALAKKPRRCPSSLLRSPNGRWALACRRLCCFRGCFFALFAREFSLHAPGSLEGLARPRADCVMDDRHDPMF